MFREPIVSAKFGKIGSSSMARHAPPQLDYYPPCTEAHWFIRNCEEGIY